MKYLSVLGLALVLVFGLASQSYGQWFLNFEWGLGHDYEWIQSGIAGLDFASDMFYADATTNGWNFSSYDLGLEWNSGYYWMEGYVAAHASSNGIGRINFDNADGSWFTTGYCAGNPFYLEAYDINDNLIDVASGAANRRYLEGNDDGLDYLTVSSASNNIAYVILHDGGYYWVADNMSGDASGVNPIPEPGTLLLLGTGLFGLGAFRFRRKK
jgi:hypothetical protein